MKSRCETFLACYLDSIGITGYEISTAEDSIGFLLIARIPRGNNERIGILKGKRSKNLSHLKSILQVIGPLEQKNPFLIIKISE